ncbi:hypothetical protein CAC42_5021 [Sphaceloma murrayae]|uniref:Uncharacterized protein n=1 Tax=Sphaceloma murrayae TaxID=2082308 RepID=A0A2K1QPM9_9PEZI|nr:hypothetical protein CAC42_5021 [Sphaceloma murrayae]
MSEPADQMKGKEETAAELPEVEELLARYHEMKEESKRKDEEDLRRYAQHGRKVSTKTDLLRTIMNLEEENKNLSRLLVVRSNEVLELKEKATELEGNLSRTRKSEEGLRTKIDGMITTGKSWKDDMEKLEKEVKRKTREISGLKVIKDRRIAELQEMLRQSRGEGQIQQT